MRWNAPGAANGACFRPCVQFGASCDGRAGFSGVNDLLDIAKIDCGALKLESVLFDVEASVMSVVDLMYAAAFQKGIGALLGP